MERGVTHDPEFEAWANKVWNFGNAQAPADQREKEVSLKDFRRNLTIDVFNEAGQKVISYKVYPRLGQRVHGAGRPRRQRQRDPDPVDQDRARGMGARPVGEGADGAAVRRRRSVTCVRAVVPGGVWRSTRAGADEPRRASSRCARSTARTRSFLLETRPPPPSARAPPRCSRAASTTANGSPARADGRRSRGAAAAPAPPDPRRDVRRARAVPGARCGERMELELRVGDLLVPAYAERAPRVRAVPSTRRRALRGHLPTADRRATSTRWPASRAAIRSRRRASSRAVRASGAERDGGSDRCRGAAGARCGAPRRGDGGARSAGRDRARPALPDLRRRVLDRVRRARSSCRSSTSARAPPRATCTRSPGTITGASATSCACRDAGAPLPRAGRRRRRAREGAVSDFLVNLARRSVGSGLVIEVRTDPTDALPRALETGAADAAAATRSRPAARPDRGSRRSSDRGAADRRTASARNVRLPRSPRSSAGHSAAHPPDARDRAGSRRRASAVRPAGSNDAPAPRPCRASLAEPERPAAPPPVAIAPRAEPRRRLLEPSSIASSPSSNERSRSQRSLRLRRARRSRRPRWQDIEPAVARQPRARPSSST